MQINQSMGGRKIKLRGRLFCLYDPKINAVYVRIRSLQLLCTQYLYHFVIVCTFFVYINICICVCIYIKSDKAFITGPC